MASAAEASASGVYGLHSASVQLFSGGIIAACPHKLIRRDRRTFRCGAGRCITRQHRSVEVGVFSEIPRAGRFFFFPVQPMPGKGRGAAGGGSEAPPGNRRALFPNSINRRTHLNMTEIIVPIITGIVCLAVGVVIGFL